MTFKVGDKVKILSKSVWGRLDSSSVYKRGKAPWYVMEIVGDGSGVGENNYIVVNDINCSNGGDFFSEKDLILIKDWDNIEVGDFIEKNNRRRKVLGVCGEMIFCSKYDNFEEAAIENQNCKSQFIAEGWTIVGAEDSEIIELTLEEVAALKGVSVDKIRIKE